MSTPPRKRIAIPIFNLPNQLTGLRLILAVIMFCVIPWGSAITYMAALVLFLLAVATDWLDGYYARRYGQVTTLGRILDPFADKVIICGAFIFLVAVPKMLNTPYGLRAWMVVVVVGRELLVTALRSFLEERGADFSAKMAGKLKMVLQCVAAGTSLFYLFFTDQPAGSPNWVWWPMVVSIWAAVLLTVYSGMIYIFAAVRLLRQRVQVLP
jgi:CDP-diacylglycerol--glycerol-3-phosphate 3-phosphatidyltransferase